MYGHASETSLLVTPLWWYSMPVPLDADLRKHAPDDHARKALDGPGVYCIEGRQDARPEGGILYIGLENGRAQADELETSDPGQALRERMSQSLGRVRWESRQEYGFHADVWDLRIRWASVDKSDVSEVEAILIHAHAPSFNRQHVRGDLPIKQHRVILNAGEKGRLLPVLSSIYFDSPYWVNLG